MNAICTCADHCPLSPNHERGCCDKVHCDCLCHKKITVDNFAGGGGATRGIEQALGKPVDYAINHDAEAVAMHMANHPETQHFCESVWAVDPREIAPDCDIDLGWFSPDCTFHSKARGGKPFRDRNTARRRRGLAWLVTRWIKARRPRVIMLENVEEFADWGPLLPDGRICPIRRGMTFRRWHREIENLGYSIDMRELRACDYGAPTTRKRLFIIMRRDGREIVFPDATHGPGLRPYRTAAECIDWSIPCPSIFERERGLAEATMRRIARGVMRYVVNNPSPFIVPLTHHGNRRVHELHEPLPTITGAHRGEHALITPFLTEHANASTQRNFKADEPLRTQCANVKGGHFALVAAFLARHYGGHENDGSQLSIPMHTVTSKDHHALVHAFLVKYYGADQDPRLEGPLHTITTKHRFGLVTVRGEPYRIVDIGMRMLAPKELFRAQSFPDSYIIDPEYNGKPLTKTSQVRMCGNSVPPVVAQALVQANVVEQAEVKAA